MLLRWWKQHLSDDIVGLDLGAETIKLIKIKCDINPCRIEHFAIETLPPGVTFKEGLDDYSTLGALVADLFKEANLEIKQVAFAIPRSAVIIKNSTLDSRLNAKEIESRIWVEANRLFPELVGEIYLDFNPVTTPNADPKQQDYTIVACRKDQIKPYLEVAKSAGLTPKIIDVNAYALERSLNVMRSNHINEAVALLNLDLGLSSLLLTENRQLLFSHDQTFDGKRLRTQTQNYIEKMETPLPPQTESPVTSADQMQFPPVVDLNTIVGATTPTYVRGSMQDPTYVNILKDNLSVHLRHSMHFLYSARPAMTIKQMVLSGDLATIPNLAAFIQQEIGIETVIADPFRNMGIAPHIDQGLLKKFAPNLMLACGLALSRSKHLMVMDDEVVEEKNK